MPLKMLTWVWAEDSSRVSTPWARIKKTFLSFSIFWFYKFAPLLKGSRLSVLISDLIQ